MSAMNNTALIDILLHIVDHLGDDFYNSAERLDFAIEQLRYVTLILEQERMLEELRSKLPKKVALEKDAGRYFAKVKDKFNRESESWKYR